MPNTALFDITPIILAGTTEGGRRYVQVWTEDGRNLAAMDDREAGSPRFAISHHCTDGIVDAALDLYARFRAGDTIEPTHTVRWEFSKPIFELIEGTQNA